ncbi:MAG TPA: MlaD family protein [Acidimicrobiia bacterium]|jgi:phospholipid/cholesterol/gamma-HCH transport system substrate-binding protein
MSPRRLAMVGAAVLVAGLMAAGGMAWLGGGSGYQVTFVFPHATNLFAGSRAQIDGFTAGGVDRLEVRDGKALVRVSIDDHHAPLRAGTTARIDYQSFPGERIVAITPGPETNAPLPDGAMITGNTPRVELDQILTALDPETRAALRHLVPELDATLAGHEEDLGATLEAAGPAIETLTDVLVAVGEDGPALHRLLGSVRELSERLVARKDAVRQTIDGFDRNLAATAGRSEQLAEGLDDLPATLRAADRVLGRVPGTAQAALPLLRDLLPAAEALPAAARDLRPFLAELRPALADLRPALQSLAAVLDETPSLLDTAHAVVPPTTAVLSSLLPAIDFLRPYTPELAGLIANLASASANYDANGHFLRVWTTAGTSTVIGAPALSPLIDQVPDRRPGELEGQPITDATGSSVR